jgi:hypothetical protein
MLVGVSLLNPSGSVRQVSKYFFGIAALVALLLAIAQPARAVTIGSDLSANAGSSGPCNAPCDWVPTEEHAVLVPTTGVLTTWRFKEFSINDLAGEVFRLVVLSGNKAVAIDTQVLPSMPGFQQNIYEFKTSIPVQGGERLGLEIPGFIAVWALNTDPAFFGDYWQPALALNEERIPDTPNVHNEHELLFNADIGAPSPPGGGGSTGGGSSGGGGGSQTGKAKFFNGGPNPTILTNDPNQFTAPAKCELPQGSPLTCSGAVAMYSISSLLSDEPNKHDGKASAKPKSVVVGKASFSIPAGQTKEIKVKLKQKAVATLRKMGKLTGTLTTTSNLTDGTKSSVSQRLTVKLKQPKPKHRLD